MSMRRVGRLGWVSVAVAIALAPAAFAGEADLLARGDTSGFLAWMLGNVDLLTIDQEREIASRVAQQVESENRMVRDSEVTSYISDLGQRLVAKVSKPEFRYTFHVIDDPAINAFSIGGGHVYVNAGVIAAADTEGELASVLAHEIGHQVNRHVAKAISRQTMFEMLARLAVGSNASQWVQLVQGLGITTGQLYFGREAEREADKVMVDLLIRAEVDPDEALHMFEKLRAMDKGRPGSLGTIFSSHPPTSERYESIRTQIARTRLPSGLHRDSRRFHEVQDRLR